MGDVIELSAHAASRERRIYLRTLALAARLLREVSLAQRAEMLADAAAIEPEIPDGR